MVKPDEDGGTDVQAELVLVQNWFQELLERVPVP